jgi:hypothetical protein
MEARCILGKSKRVVNWLRMSKLFFKKAKVGNDFVRNESRLDYRTFHEVNQSKR